MNGKLYSYKKSPTSEVVCNFDFKQYDHSVYLIDKEQINSHFSSLRNKKYALIAVSSQKINMIDNISDFPLIKGESRIRPATFCFIKKQNNSSFYLSGKSRDSGQHLYHLFKFSLHKKKSINSVDALIRHSRHLFLSEPLRLIVEAKRSTKTKLQELLNLHIPVYHAEHLGNIWAIYDDDEVHGLVIDDRNAGASSCNL